MKKTKKFNPLDTPFVKKFNPETETHQSDLAQVILQNAINQVTSKGKQHGDTVNSFAMIASLWTTYVQNVAVMKSRTEIGPNDVAQMMVLMKIARSVYGSGEDNYTDGAGYTALSYMLQPDFTEEPDEVV